MISKERLKAKQDYLYNLEASEDIRQMESLDMIASESLMSINEQKALSSSFVRKYSEGLPNERYYGGCSVVDELEDFCCYELLNAFDPYGMYKVNVQVPNGSQANQAVYMAVLDVGDTILSMDTKCGGHISHSLRNGFLRQYNVVTYGVKENGYIDYDEVKMLAEREHPKLIVCGASSYPRQINYEKFREIADSVGACLLVDMAHIAGFVAAKLLPSPFGYADFVTTTFQKTLCGCRSAAVFCLIKHFAKLNRAVFPSLIGGCRQSETLSKAYTALKLQTDDYRKLMAEVRYNAQILANQLACQGLKLVTGGTDTHMVVVDLTDLGLTGKEVEEALEKIGIVCNRQGIPHDKRKPSEASGIRLGTTVATQRGAKSEEIVKIANIVANTIFSLRDKSYNSICKDLKRETNKIIKGMEKL